MKKISFLLFLLFLTCKTNAYTKADIFNSEIPITWLGFDFTQLKFIGKATQWQDVGEISSAEIRDKYFPAWNDKFVNDKERYIIPDAIKRMDVKYGTDVSSKANSNIKSTFFEDNPSSYQLLDEDKINTIVSKHDFKNYKGIGFIFFVEGMDKKRKEASVWVTFVDIEKHKVLLTKRLEGKASGFGFSNFWIKSLKNVFEEVKDNWKNWSE